MPSQGPLYPGATATDGSGDVAWTNLSLLAADDGSGAFASNVPASFGTTDGLEGTQFGFSIPSGATITGILAGIEGRSTFDDDLITIYAYIIKGGVRGSTNMEVDGQNLQAAWSQAGWGGSVSLWGETWTPADINASNFGFVWGAWNIDGASARNLEADYMRLTVYYTLPPTAVYLPMSRRG